MFNRIANRKAWTNGKVTITLPCDKRTFRIVARDDAGYEQEVSSHRFRSFESAAKFAAGL